jgi:alkanesulfonate monooxygenase SsuD/methylene tetrahydromethanopterin reductase-like flavin-dependent oxidoreductase (luciferase family)
MPIARPFQFHWSSDSSAGWHDTDHFLALCADAEQLGLDSVHVPAANNLSSAFELAILTGRQGSRIKLRIGCGLEQVLASLTGRDLSNAWQELGSRLIVHLTFPEPDPVDRGAFLAAAEFLVNCRNLFPPQQGPQFDIRGESSQAAILAIKHADCLWRRAQHPRQVHADALPVLHFGKQTGLVFDIVARPSRDEAFASLNALLPEVDATSLPSTAAGIVALDQGRPPVLVGAFSEVAQTLSDFHAAGITQCMLGSLRHWEEIAIFAQHVLPLVRENEHQRQVA